ncbi:hypothetical protein T05_15997, partial [Trichinella murrelli]
MPLSNIVRVSRHIAYVDKGDFNTKRKCTNLTSFISACENVTGKGRTGETVEASSTSDDCDSSPIGATNHPSPTKEPLVTLGACPGNHTSACVCPPLAFCQEVYFTECLEKLEDFFWPNGVLTSNLGVVERYLLCDPVRYELYLWAARSTSTGELLRGSKEEA